MLPKNIDQLDKVREECYSMVTKRASISGVSSLVPVPGADIAADVGLLMELIPAINSRFGLSPEQIEKLDPKIKSYVFIAARKIGTDLVGKYITKKMIMVVIKRLTIRMTAKTVAKFIPFLGPAISSSIGFAAMKLMGNSHVDDCYSIAKSAIEERDMQRSKHRAKSFSHRERSKPSAA